ncbi:MAG: hypothetical protein IKX60_00420 [Bacteroidales bacterium]|nr:hypothetical protein [Bacteroidales bacterium]
MKKLFVLLSAVALFGLVSCSQNEGLNPSKEGVKDEVKTSFTINVATNAKTKATATEVQDETAFRGMEKMKLFVFKDLPTKEDPMADYQYDLGSLSANDISDAQSSKIYNLSIPLGVNNMLFYGRAKVSSTVADYRQYGFLDYNVGTKKSEIFFNTKPIVDDLTNFQAAQNALAGILNDVLSATGWVDLVGTTDVMLKPLDSLYTEFTTIREGEFRDGSGPAIVRVLTDIQSVVSKITSPAAAATVAAAIKAKVDNYVSGGAFVSAYNQYDEFPASLGLPNGSAQLTFNKTSGEFEYVSTPGKIGDDVSVAVASVSDFIYPAELTYFVSSPIRVSAEEVEEEDFPVTVATWSAREWNSKWPVAGINGTVASDTRAVALQNNIQYGVALLKTTVKYAAATVADNREAVLKAKNPESTEKDMDITVDGNSFQINGILVGGQPAGADNWWLPKADGTKVVYDNYMNASGPAAIPASGQSDPVYTMVLDNYSSSGKQSVVYVALELKNNTGADFYGHGNVIPKDGIFYMVGKLDLANLTTAQMQAVEANYPVNTDGNGIRMAPFASDGTNDQVIRVFMQDFVTEANFTITNLHGAYATVPDLKSVEMIFGLSVDLKWKAGASFDITLD